MVMKDKLVKTNHKANYYIFRKAVLFTMIFAAIGVTATVTTYLAVSTQAKAAETSEVSEVEESTVDSSDSLTSISE